MISKFDLSKCFPLCGFFSINHAKKLFSSLLCADPKTLEQVHVQKEYKKNERTAHFKKEQKDSTLPLPDENRNSRNFVCLSENILRTLRPCAALLFFPTVTILSVTICSVHFLLHGLVFKVESVLLFVQQGSVCIHCVHNYSKSSRIERALTDSCKWD